MKVRVSILRTDPRLNFLSDSIAFFASFSANSSLSTSYFLIHSCTCLRASSELKRSSLVYFMSFKIRSLALVEIFDQTSPGKPTRSSCC